MNLPRVSRDAHRLYRRWILNPIRGRLLSRSGLPIVAVTGTNGKTTVARLLDQVLRKAGYRVGMSCTDGVMLHGEWVKRGDHAGPNGVRLATKNGGIDVLVAETARGGILTVGFGFRTCTVAVVTNVSDDHLGFDGVETVDQMARIKARVAKRVRDGGVAVLNADDPRVAAMAERVRGSVTHFSMRRLPPDFRRCLYVHENSIWRRQAGVETRLIPIGDIAITRHGLLPHNAANAMAVLGALDGLRSELPIDDELVLNFLKTADGDLTERGLFHLLEYDGNVVLITNSKNPAGYAADMPSVSKIRSLMGYEAVVGIITHVGNRRPSFHRAIAAASAEVCDHVMTVPPRNGSLHGATKESIVKALEAGIPVEKRLPLIDGDSPRIIACLRAHFPKRTLYVLFGSHHHRGLMEIIENGTKIELQCSESGTNSA